MEVLRIENGLKKLKKKDNLLQEKTGRTTMILEEEIGTIKEILLEEKGINLADTIEDLAQAILEGNQILIEKNNQISGKGILFKSNQKENN